LWRGFDLDFGGGGSFGGCFCACVQPLTWSALGLFAGCEPEAFAVHLQDEDKMREAVEERAGEPFLAEDRSPFIEWQVAGDERVAAVPPRTAVDRGGLMTSPSE